VERTNIANTVAFLLSLNSFKVEELKYQFGFLPPTSTVYSSRRRLRALAGGEKGDRKLQSEISTYLALAIIPEPYSAVYPSPLDLAKKMNLAVTKTKMIGTYPTFDTSYVVPTTEFVAYTAGFASNPVITNITFSTMIYNVRLDNFGWIFCVCVKATQDLGKPSPYQIEHGTDVNNIPVPGTYIEITQSYTYFNVTVNHLDADTMYNLYVSSGSAHPGYPDLLNTNLTNIQAFSTLKSPPSKLLSPTVLKNYSVFSVAELQWAFHSGLGAFDRPHYYFNFTKAINKFCRQKFTICLTQKIFLTPKNS
jgi:hypothetical protein